MEKFPILLKTTNFGQGRIQFFLKVEFGDEEYAHKDESCWHKMPIGWQAMVIFGGIELIVS